MTDVTEHTHGPWHASRKFVYVSDINNRCIAEVFDRHEANARLIAAAPDLLDAILKSDDAHWTPAMRAAIKKATKPLPTA